MKLQVYRIASLEPGVAEVEDALDESLLALGPAEDLVARRVGDDHVAGGGPLAPPGRGRWRCASCRGWRR